MAFESQTKNVINAPLEGEWKFLRPPGHHPFAFDFVKTHSKNKKVHRNSKLRFVFGRILSDAYYCWEEPIYAPISGKVIRVGDGWPDHEYTNLWNTIKIWYNATYKFRPREEDAVLDIRPNAGNHVMIQSDNGYIVFLAHFRNNSVTVRQGEQVEQGEQLGLVGNSGNSSAPHLHINLFDQMDDPFNSKVLPFAFSSYEILTNQGTWRISESSVPKVGSLVKFQRITKQAPMGPLG